MIKFYLELSNSERKFRLQSDREIWREIYSCELQPDDFITENIYEIIRLQDEKWWKISAEGSFVSEEISLIRSFKEVAQRLFYRVFAIRGDSPVLPSKEQLISVIRQGDDRLDNTLVLNIDGLFELRSYRMGVIADPTVIVRFKRFPCNEGYVGVTASNEEELMERYYRESIRLWLEHNTTGKMNIFCHYNSVDYRREW